MPGTLGLVALFKVHAYVVRQIIVPIQLFLANGEQMLGHLTAVPSFTHVADKVSSSSVRLCDCERSHQQGNKATPEFVGYGPENSVPI